MKNQDLVQCEKSIEDTNLKPMSYYVVIAIEDGRVKECVLNFSGNLAMELYKKFRETYGGENAYIASRFGDDVPINLQLEIHNESQLPS